MGGGSLGTPEGAPLGRPGMLGRRLGLGGEKGAAEVVSDRRAEGACRGRGWTGPRLDGRGALEEVPWPQVGWRQRLWEARVGKDRAGRGGDGLACGLSSGRRGSPWGSGEGSRQVPGPRRGPHLGGSFGRPRVGVLPGARSPSPWRVRCRALGRPGGGGLPGRASHPRRVERFAQVAARGPGQSGEVGGQGRLSAGSAWEAARGGCPGPAAGGWMASGDGRPGLGQRWRCPGPDGDGGL